MSKNNMINNLTFFIVLLCLFLFINTLTGCGETPNSSKATKPTPKPTLKVTPKPTLKPTLTPKPTATLKSTPTVKPAPTVKPTPTPSPLPKQTTTPKPTTVPTPLPLMEWYKYRQDKEMTGYSRGNASMSNAPHLDWSYDIAAWQGYFLVTGNPGHYDTKVLPYHNPVGVDYYRNNKNKWGVGTPQYDLSGNGKLVAVADDPAIKVADFLKDRMGLEKVVMDNYYQVGDQAHARLYAYDNGREQLIWTSAAFPTCYGPMVCGADVNDDGQMDVVISMHYRLVVLNGATGTTMFNFNYMKNRNYGFLGVANIDDDPYPEFCVICDFDQHIEVIDNNGSCLSLKWFIQVEDCIFRNTRITQPGPDSFIDVDHDGQVEVVCNIFNYHNNQLWSILVFNALNGAVKYELTGCYLNGLADINSDGYIELFTTVTSGVEIPTYGELSIRRVIPNTGFKVLWTYPHARFHARDMDSLPLTVNTSAVNGRTSIVHGRIDQALPEVFLVSEPGRENGEVCNCFGFDENNQVRNRLAIKGPEHSTLDGLAVRGTDSDLNSTGILLSVTTLGMPDEVLTITNGTAELKQWTRKTPVYAGPPVTADLGGDGTMEIITSTSDQMITCFDAPRSNQGHDIQIRWRMKGQGMTDSAPNTQDGVLIADLDQDHRKEVIFAREDATGKACIVAVRSDGSLMWQCIFQGFDGSPPVWNLGGITYWIAGNFTSRSHQDLYVSIRRSKMHSDVGFLLDGRDGRILWQRDGILIPGGNPVLDIRGHGGDRVAAADMDNDGLDELVCAYPDRVYIVDGPSGQPSVIKSTAWSLFPGDWTAYAIPVLVNLKGNSIPEIFYGRSGYLTALLDSQVNLIWQRDLNTDGNNGCKYLQGIGDCNNDGYLEIGGIYKNPNTGQYEFRFYKADSGENFLNSSATVNSINLQGRYLYSSPVEKLLMNMERVYFEMHEENEIPAKSMKQGSGTKSSKNIFDSGNGGFSLQGLGTPCTDVVTADLDGDRRAEFLFGIGNSLQCVNSQGLKWSINTGGVPGEIALADVNRDGKLEIIVCTDDGYLKVYR